MSETTAATAADHGRDDALDGFRAIAALLVFFYHAGWELKDPPLAVLGSTGVHIFFALSGYLMFGPFARAMWRGLPQPSWPRFAIRRVFRVYPTYLVALAGFSTIEWLYYGNPPPLGKLVPHALLVFNLLGRHTFFSINPVFWSLAVEAQFYVLLPIVCALVARSMPRMPRASALMVPALFVVVALVTRAAEYEWRPIVDPDEPRFATVFSFLDLFAWGMLVSLAEVAGWTLGRARGWLVAGAVAVFFAANDWSVAATTKGWFFGSNVAFTLVYPSAVCAAAAMVLWAIRARRPGSRTFLEWRPLVWVGKVSYSLYLAHFGVQMLVWHLLPPRGGGMGVTFLYGCIALVPSLGLAGLMYRLIEAPGMRLGSALIARRAAARAARSAPAPTSQAATP